MVRARLRAPSVLIVGVAAGCWLFGCTEGTRAFSDNGSESSSSGATPPTAGASGRAPLTYRVLLAASVAGGSTGTGTATVAGGVPSNVSSSAVTSAGTASINSTAAPPCQSAYCGDGCHDLLEEECDDGAGSPGSFCNWACQSSDNWASHTTGAGSGGVRVKRMLGRGRHPVAASTERFAVSLVEAATAQERVVRVAQFTATGTPINDVVLSNGTWIADRADPVVAVLGQGDAVTTFTEFGGDGDGLGIALRRLRAGQTQPEPVQWASEPSFAAQYDPDILALPDRILVAYTDEYDAVTGPDITVREFDLELKPKGTVALGNSSDVEGRVGLAKLGASWGAAWRRAAADGSEYVEVYDAASSAHWTVGPHAAADADDIPALVSADATHRVVIYTRSESTDQAYPIGKLYFALLDTAQPGVVLANGVLPTTAAYSDYVGLAMRTPSAVQSGNALILGWTSAQRRAEPIGNGEEAWFERISATVAGNELQLTMGGELPIPRFSTGRLGDQRGPALALLEPGASHPSGSLVAAWEDYAETLGTSSAEPEVLTYLTALDLHRNGTAPASDCTTTALCTAGKGRCTASNQCASPLVCSVANGKNFGYGTDVGVCVPAHCADGILNSGETLVDCGGADCGTCRCGDGITSPEFNEACDTAGNSASCDSDCTVPVCGDGLLNTAAGEQCDLGANNGPSSGCLTNCTGTPSCTDGATCFGVHAQGIDSGAAVIRFNLNLVNNTSQAQPLSGTTLHYWFTGDGASNYTLACDYSPTVPCSAISGALYPFTPIRRHADRVMKINLNTTATLAANSNSGEIQLRINKDDGTANLQINDYSVSQTTMQANNRIGMYRNGSLIWGIPPSQDYACGDTVTDPGEACDNAVNTRCAAGCQGFAVSNGTACTNATQCISVEHFSSDPIDDNQLRPSLRIVNRSGKEIALSRIKLKYWFTAESSTEGLVVTCGAGPGPNNNCGQTTVTAERISPTFATANAVITVTFTSTAVLGITDKTGEIQINLNESQWSKMDEANDWSRTGAASFTTAPKVALYVDNQLWWGEEAK